MFPPFASPLQEYRSLSLPLKKMDIIRSWREQKALLKRIFPILSDEDFVNDQEDRESVLKKLGFKLNKSRVELDLLLAELQRL